MAGNHQHQQISLTAGRSGLADSPRRGPTNGHRAAWRWLIGVHAWYLRVHAGSGFTKRVRLTLLSIAKSAPSPIGLTSDSILIYQPPSNGGSQCRPPVGRPGRGSARSVPPPGTDRGAGGGCRGSLSRSARGRAVGDLG